MKIVHLKSLKYNKVSFIIALVFSLFFFSCIKKRTCVCNVNGVFSSTATIQRTTHKKAKEKCSSYSGTETNGSNVDIRECSLK